MMLAIAVLTLGGATLAAKLLEHQVEAGWRELALRPADPVLHGEALSSELGDLSIDPLNNYVARELAAGDDVVDPPPQEVDYFLVVHRGEIDALRQRLLTGPPPVLGEATVSYYRMQKILLVDALETRSWRDIEAARMLTEAMLRQPDLSAVLFAIAANENQLGVARKLDPPRAASLPAFDPHER